MALKEDSGTKGNLKLFEDTNIHFQQLFDSNVSPIYEFCKACGLITCSEALMSDIWHESGLQNFHFKLDQYLAKHKC